MPPSFAPATITHRVDWDEGLFTLTLDRAADFRAGQFLTLSRDPDGGRHARRAYSIASAPGAPLEFFIVEVEDGQVSPGLRALQPGDPLWTTTRGKGLFTLDDVPPGRELWMVATGTGLAPYLSMIREGSVFQAHERVILAYGARHRSHLAYLDELAAHADRQPLTVLTLTSREPAGDGHLAGRVTARFEDGALEDAAGARVAPDRSHVLLCGNPAMIADMMALLEARGLTRHTRRSPGHVTTEKYW